MAESKGGGTDGFVRAFLPGLVLGLLIGAFAGAYLPTVVNTGSRSGPVGASGRVSHDTSDPAVRDAVEQYEQGRSAGQQREDRDDPSPSDDTGADQADGPGESQDQGSGGGE